MARTNAPASDTPPPIQRLFAGALRASLRKYGKGDLRSDVLAGVVVGVVALPLSMALAIAVHAPPQTGLYTAIVAGFLVAALGGSRTQVTGPTAAFIVILAPITAKYGMAGLLVSGLLGGLILVLMGVFRLGKLIEFIPYPVTTGFTAGIATVIATLQLKDFLGLPVQGRAEHYWELVGALWTAKDGARLSEFAVGAVSLAFLILLPRLTRKIPAPLLVLPAVAAGAALLHHFIPGFEVATVAGRFPETRGIPRLPPLPVLPWELPGADGKPFELDFDTIKELIPGAFAIAMLGAIESLLSAVVADGMARTKHDPDAELLALGIGNVVTPFLGGIPATGAIARTATNIRFGARTPVASMVHALTVLAAVLALAPLIGYLPMASLAALLLVVAWNMADLKHCVRVLKVAPTSDRMVLAVCFSLTVAIDMVVSVMAGVLLAALLFMRRMAEITNAKIVDARELGGNLNLPKGVVVYDIAGPLFFGAAEKAMGAIEVVGGDVKAVVIRMDQVPVMDATGLVALESAIEELQRHKVMAILVGCRAQPRKLIREARLKDRFKLLRVKAGIQHAVRDIEAHLEGRERSGQTSTRLRAVAP
jgi:SulP family sulfate permease